VEVDVLDDQLLIFVPNATGLEDSRDGTTLGAASTLAGHLTDDGRLKVYRDAPGMVCDAATGTGCVEITDEWLVGMDQDSMAALAAVDADPGVISCEQGRYADGARGLTPEERDICDRGPPIAALFVLAFPVTMALLAPDGGDTETVSGFPPEDEGDPGTTGGDGDGGGGGTGDDGGGGGTGDDGGGGGTGGDDGGTGGDDGSGDDGDDGGDDGGWPPPGGDDGGDDGEWPPPGGDDGEWPPPGGDDGPPLTEVPEPVSTTLGGLGLAGYAGSRLRKRFQTASDPEDGPV
jgi:hypothetical protein